MYVEANLDISGANSRSKPAGVDFSVLGANIASTLRASELTYQQDPQAGLDSLSIAVSGLAGVRICTIAVSSYEYIWLHIGVQLYIWLPERGWR